MFIKTKAKTTKIFESKNVKVSLQDVIQLSLFLGLAGNKEVDKISFSFFSLLYKVLMDLDGEIFFKFSSVYNIDRLFCMML